MLPTDRKALEEATVQMQKLSGQLVRLEERDAGHSRTLDRLERMISANASSVSQLIEGLTQIRELVNGHERDIRQLQRATGVSAEIAQLPLEVAQLRAVDEHLSETIAQVQRSQDELTVTVRHVDRKMMWWGGGIAALTVVATIVIGMARWRIVGEAPPPSTVILKVTDGTRVDAAPEVRK